MAHSFTNLLYHVVFSTKHRQPWLEREVKQRVCAYLGGIIREEGGIALAIDGMSDHVHILAKLRQDKAVSDVVRAVKALSSGWIHRTFSALEPFSWQTGYGCFTVSHSQVEIVRRYIQNQEIHHHRRNYRDEIIALLRANGLEFNESDILE